MRFLQSRLPIMLSVLTVGLCTLFGVRKLASWHGPAVAIGGVMLALYLVWLLVEARVAKGEMTKGVTHFDRGTLELYAAARIATVLAAFVVNATAPSLPVILAGLLAFVGGVAFRLRAIRELGRFYSHRVRVRDSHRIVDTGPYRFVRHPAYTGMLLAHAGLVTAFFNWLTLGIFLGVMVPAVVVRILVEERTLAEVAGYSEYCEGRKRLLPAVW